MQRPVPTWLYRITHYENLPHILQHGVVTANHERSASDWISIGHNEIINYRSEKLVTVPPYGTLSDYVPFYFGRYSPMLYVIMNGYLGVKHYPQNEIIHLVSSLEAIKNTSCQWCFTDGHAWDSLATFYSEESDLDKVHWDLVDSKLWKDDEEHIGRKFRKQAELLVKEKVPIECLQYILTYDEHMRIFAANEVLNAGLNIEVKVSRHSYF